MPGTRSDGEALALDTFPHMDSPQSWRGEGGGDTLRSTVSQLSGESASKSSADSPSTPVELGTEAREKEGRRSSWMKNLGSGMRTLRLKKSADKPNILKMTAIDQQPKEDTPTKEDAPDSAGPSSAAAPNVVPPFENETPPGTTDSIHSSKDGKSSLRRGWRKRGGAKANTVNGAASGAGAGGTPKSGEAESGGPNKADPSRFIGEGLCFKAKLIGVLEVSGPRGDRICQEALSELKMAVKAAGEHKQKVSVHVALEGLRLRDEKSGDCLYHHPVHKISFIAQDLTDSRAFGYIFGAPDTGHRFFGIKTDKSASGVVMAMRDLFQVVFDLKKKEIERAKQQLEMQQKFLATRAAEGAPPRAEAKGGRLAETYIEGACALPSPNSSRTAPAEADLLNLETELTSLQEGLDNIHSNLHNPHAPFNRGSTSSISSDPHSALKHASHNNRASSTTGHMLDPFGDSFDPFDSTSRFIPPDPFSNIDPFPPPKPGLGLLEGPGDSDPFLSPPPTAFAFPDRHARTSTASSSSSRYAAMGETLNGPTREERPPGRELQPVHWTASFEDNFVPETMSRPNGPDGSKAEAHLSLDIFRELDPLGTGREKPFVDRKDFFQELKNPAQMHTKELTTTAPATKAEAIPNSFSTNFNPPVSSAANVLDFASHFKVPAPKSELKTSSIRLGASDSPPNYTPPLPPPSFTASNSIYFTNPTPAPTLSGPPSRNGSKRSPQLLKRMTISTGGAKNSVSPRGSGRGQQHTLDSSSNDEIPNITPPPRPPHSGTVSRNASITTALPRPHSAKSDAAGRPGSAEYAPEPPPRPLLTTQPVASTLPLVSPPPLPPKKQPVFNLTGLATGRAVNGKPHLGTRTSDGGSANDLPLPLPSRKNGHETIPRYAVPPSFEKEARPLFASPARKQVAAATASTTALSRTKASLTMEQALSQVATLSLGQLASRLELPVEQLSSLTIQQLAERLTNIDLHDDGRGPGTVGFETNFEPDDFSTVSAPSTMEGVACRDLKKSPASYDKYAAFRELTAEDASGFSIIATLDSKEGSGSRTLTSRDSSSERTLQADDDNPLATMDDVTDANLSEAEERSMLDEEVGDDYLEATNKLPPWATFDSHFGEQAVPLESAFNKSEDSPSWDSDENAPAIAPLPTTTPDVRPKALKTTKIESHASQFDFQPFRRANPRLEDAVEEGQSALDPLVQSGFQRQSSGSSKHSGDRYAERGSDYSGGSTGRENRPASGRKLDVPPDSREVVRGRDSRPSSYSSSGRKYSRGESDDLDDEPHHQRRRQYDTTPTRGHGERRRRRYYERDEGGVENPSFDPNLAAEHDETEPRSRKHPREFVDEPELEEDDDRSFSSRHSNLSPGSGPSHRHHRRRHHAPKYYSQSLHRRGRDDRFSPRDRRDFSPDRYSNHESDCDSFEEDSRRGRREREYYRDPEYSSRPSSGSGRRSHYREPYRGGSRDAYYREGRHGRREPRRHRDLEEREDYSEEEEARYARRHRGRRPHHARRDREDERYYSNSASWESESPPPLEPRADRKRHSAGKGGRPVSASLSMMEPFDEPSSDRAPKQRPTPHAESNSQKSTESAGRVESTPGSRKMSVEERQMAFDDNFEEPPLEARPSEGPSEEGAAFFPSSFDVEMEGGVDEEEAMEVKTPELGGPAPEAKILSMISEESHHSNSNNSAEAGPEGVEGAEEVELKKSDSFNIFERELDPFAEDDFFK